ncbi:MAG: hypothetical protein ABSA93_34810 [Streptosporangiaceae bacterium]|jgi:hypothetical protein
MANLRHQAVAQLFRDNDELAPYLVAARGEMVRAGRPVRHDSDLSTIDHGLELPIPMHKEARADVVTIPNFQVRLIVVDRLSTPHPDALGGEACVVQVTMLSVLNGSFDLADPDVRKYLEDDMNLADLRVPFLDDPVDEALAKGQAIGEARGVARGEAKLLRRIIQTRGFSITSRYQAMVEDCTDLEQIETWAERAVTAETIDDIFGS